MPRTDTASRVIAASPDRDYAALIDPAAPAVWLPPIGTMTMRWELGGVDGGTRVDIIADDVPDGNDADDHAAGLAPSLTNLTEYLEG